MTLKTTILNNWATDFNMQRQAISNLEEKGFPAWTFRNGDAYGVAIPYVGDDDVNENFSGAKIQSTTIDSGAGEPLRVLTLTTRREEFRNMFSELCSDFVDPGNDGEHRRDLEKSPVSWWADWKDLLGNSSTDKKVYDVLGELCVLLYAARNGENVRWNGPNGASYDIETESRFIEVKSTVDKFKREITVSNQFQLSPPEKPLNLVFCAFEKSVDSGISIDGIMDEMREAGVDTDVVEKSLETLGFEKGMNSRRKRFILQEMLLYVVDVSFPRIIPDSFVDGVLPKEIVKIDYTVDISGLTSVSLLKEGVNG